VDEEVEVVFVPIAVEVDVDVEGLSGSWFKEWGRLSFVGLLGFFELDDIDVVAIMFVAVFFAEGLSVSIEVEVGETGASCTPAESAVSTSLCGILLILGPCSLPLYADWR
jgi:hypothetical protein